MDKKSWLGKIFDMSLWQNIQDNFSEALGLPISTIDEHGEELVTSGKPPFFYQIIRSRQEGRELTKKNRAEMFYMLKRGNEKILYVKDFTGLTTVAIPIRVNGRYICAIVCDGIVQNVRDGSYCSEISASIGVGKDELISALEQIPVKSVIDVQMVGSLLQLFSKLAPNLASEKIKSDRKISELTILNRISQMVNSTLDLERILNSVMKFMLQSISATTCSILIFDEKKRFSITSASKELLMVESAVARDVQNTKSTVRIPQLTNDYRFSELHLEFSSMIAFPLKSRGDVIGVINLYGDGIHLDESDVEFLTVVTSQVSMALSNAKQFQKIKESAITDKLTGLYNRRHVLGILQNEAERSQRFETPFSVSMIDIDYFKTYNDTNGHPAGDKLLREVSALLNDSVRTIDTVGRYGGEEFIIVLPKTKPHEAKAVMERVRQTIEESHFDHEEKQPSGRITVSVGLVTSMKGDMNTEEMIMEADKNLYKSKASGRNVLTSSVVVSRNMNPIDVMG